MIFYLSSQGHAATKWISDAFSLHPNVVSFHGIRTIPPVLCTEKFDFHGVQLQELTGGSPLVAETLAKSLHQCAKHSGKVFGAVHTVWGLHCKDPIENLGGNFGGIIRHPIMQFHSMMNAFTPRAVSHGFLPVDHRVEYSYVDIINAINTDPDRFVYMVRSSEKKFKNCGLSGKADKIKLKILGKLDNKNKNINATTISDLLQNRSQEVILNLLARCFASNVRRVFDDHWLFSSKLSEDKIVVMEKITSDIDYFKEKFLSLTGLSFPDAYTDKVFKVEHGNTHTRTRTTPEEIWDSWPNHIQILFTQYQSQYSGLTELYEDVGYWMPNK
jgi:hypothetical protein